MIKSFQACSKPNSKQVGDGFWTKVSLILEPCPPLLWNSCIICKEFFIDPTAQKIFKWKWECMTAIKNEGVRVLVVMPREESLPQYTLLIFKS